VGSGKRRWPAPTPCVRTAGVEGIHRGESTARRP
jgi:hypothetical protein